MQTFWRFRHLTLCWVLTALSTIGCSSGGGGTDDSLPSSSVNASSSSSSSGAPSASSSTSSSTSSSGSSGSSSSSGGSSTSSGAVELLSQGKSLFDTQGCEGCHGSEGNGPKPIIVHNWTEPTLAVKIRDTMPSGNPASCNEQCAQAIAAYIMTWDSATNCDMTTAKLPRRLRLLTPHEYRNTINDLMGFGPYSDYASELPRTELVRGYDNNVPQIHASVAHATQYWNAAETIAAAANVSNLVNCNGQTAQACATQFLTTFGTRAFRRPLSEEEISTYRNLFLSQDEPEDGIRLVLKSILISPSFLYRFEMGEPNGSGGFVLTPYEIASLLSYTFWGTMPDEALFNLAQNQSLQNPDTLLAQATRLIQDDRAEHQMVHFAKQWLGIENIQFIFKDPSAFPRYNSAVANAMENEFELFITDAFLNQTSQFKDLFLADFVFANQTLANFYELSGASGSQLQKIPAGSERGGILNLGGLLVTHAKMDQTSPIARGVMVRERLLCQEFPPPPANAGGIIPLNPNLTTRERFSAHTNNDGCRDCHIKIDPIGFAFERYDGAGQYRETEGNNLAVDESGEVTGLVTMADTDAHPFNGTQGLSNILAHAQSAHWCLADQFHTYFQGVSKPDTCVVNEVYSRWQQADFTLTDLWLESVKSPSFIQRQ